MCTSITRMFAAVNQNADAARQARTLAEAATEAVQEACAAEERVAAEQEELSRRIEYSTPSWSRRWRPGWAGWPDGDLTFRLGETFPEAYRQIQDDFNQAMERLQETMKIVVANTLGIRSGADDISQAALDLARRTEQQADSLKETAEALNSITTTVKQTSPTARGRPPA